jgi:hypothetical protein
MGGDCVGRGEDRLCAEQQVGNHDWWSISSLIGPQLSSSIIAANAGITAGGDRMQTMLAYSVLSEGVRPFAWRWPCGVLTGTKIVLFSCSASAIPKINRK